MAIPRKPKPAAPPQLAAMSADPETAIAEALAPVEAAPALLAAPAQTSSSAELASSAQTAAADFQALLKENTDKAMAEAKAAQERVRAAAEQNLEQTRAAYARIKAVAEDATSSLETSYAAVAKGWSELTSKAIEMAQSHANAHFDHVKAVIAAKSVPEVVSLQTEHVKARIASASEQMKDLASVAQKVAADAGEPIKAILSKRFAA